MRLSFLLLAALVSAQQQPPPQRKGGFAPPSYKLTDAETAGLRAKVDQFGALLNEVRATRPDPDLLADVEVFEKAGRWLVEFPEDFFAKQDVANTLAVLERGMERARQLKAGASPWTRGARRLHGFRSDVDGSVQPYGVRVPTSYDGSKPVRLYVWLHGRAQTLTEASFLHGYENAKPSPSDPANEGQIQLDVYGRWNGIAYHWAGEADVFEAIAAVKKRYRVDDKRVILRGFSMGGAGAWHLAMHHPGKWAAAEIGAGTWPRRSLMPGFPPHQQATLRIHENIVEWALNFFTLPLAAHGGDRDPQVASIPPPEPGTPTRGQVESELRVRAQLEKEGFASEGRDEYELRPKGTPTLFLLSKDTGHGTSPVVRKKLDAFLKEYGDRGIVSPDRVRFLTYTARYNRSHWVTLDRLEKHYERAEVDARRSPGGTYDVSTKNVARLVLRETERAASVKIDGVAIAVKVAPELAFDKTASGWRQSKGAPKGLHKVHGLQGPIDDAFQEPFLIVRPTGSPWNPEAQAQVLRMLARFDRLYARNLRAHPRVIEDSQLKEADFARHHVVLLGDPGSNRWIAKTAAKLPVKWSRDSVVVSGQTFSSKDHFPALIYPSPVRPGRYVVINTMMTFDDREYRGDYAMPKLGDWAVLKVKDGSESPDVAAAGLFDEEWRIR